MKRLGAFFAALALISMVSTSCSPRSDTSWPEPGAFYSGQDRNPFAKLLGKSDKEIQIKLDAAWEHLFYGDDSTQRVYYPVGDDMAYIEDIGHGDVRSEGMSYGMMIAVQMDKQEEFDRLWKWTKTYMYQDRGSYEGYFAWHCLPDGSPIDTNPASDGEEWFAMALFFAADRWGNGEGIYNYEVEAQAILHTMLHKADEGRGLGTNMFDPEHKQVVFVPKSGRASQFTDPSYLFPITMSSGHAGRMRTTSSGPRPPSPAGSSSRKPPIPRPGLCRL
jgi:oligosaccharide reducing-end xylanase